MTSSEIEPLEPGMWFEHTAKLLERFKSSKDDEDLEAALRRAYFLLQLAPRPLREFLRPAISESRFEAFIDVGAFDSAAIGLIAEPAAIEVARTLGASRFSARVWITGTRATSICVQDKNAAKATLGALLEGISALCSLGASDMAHGESIQSHLRLHKRQSGQHRQKTPH